MMMALGFFVFSLHTAAYQELQRQLAWRHASVTRHQLRRHMLGAHRLGDGLRQLPERDAVG